jgi:hypothetical protein
MLLNLIRSLSIRPVSGLPAHVAAFLAEGGAVTIRTDNTSACLASSFIGNGRPSWLYCGKIASSAHVFVQQQTKTLALRFFFNEAFRFDAQTYVDWKHQTTPRFSL